MPSFGDTALIALIALLLFGPKKLPELARQLGKLMGDFRRASNEFRMQMEDELRLSEQAENQKKIAAMEAAAPVAPVYQDESLALEHPHMPPAGNTVTALESTIAQPSPGFSEAPTDAFADAAKPDRTTIAEPGATEVPAARTEPLPIATSGDLSMMPPATGLPANRSPLSSVFDAIPHTPDPELTAPSLAEDSPREASLHG